MNASQYFSDTLVWCLASGCAFWIGFKCSDLMRFFSASEIEKQFESTNIAGTTKWISLGIKLWMVEQRPGDIVISPSSVEGCGHVVMSFGSCLVHSAWNRGVMPCALAFTAVLYRHPPPNITNGAASTRGVLPLLRFQKQGMNLGPWI
jgi:hypothetical protein